MSPHACPLNAPFSSLRTPLRSAPEDNPVLLQGNIMHDRRVVRGNTYAAQVRTFPSVRSPLPTPLHPRTFPHACTPPLALHRPISPLILTYL